MGARPEAESIAITDYNPTWPLQFEVLRPRLASVLQGRALSIEYVGSTAVPGLTAKPIIDLNVAIASPTDLPAAIAALAPREPRHHLARSQYH